MTNPTRLPDLETDLNGVCALPHLGVIQAVGEDAAKFLHNQLTQDFTSLDTAQARFAALCTAKGRMQASFIGIRRAADDAILLVCEGDLLAQTLKRLSMFVLRAKVKLSDASADFSLHGLLGPAVAANTGGAAPAPWALAEAGPASVVGLYPARGQVARALWIAPADAAAPAGQVISADFWRWAEITSGVAMVGAPVAEAFVPQMLNYESVGGVNFKKGCYPGQEVVARSQFRGTLKRRAYIAHCDAALAAGDEVFHGSEAAPGSAEPCGLVVQAAPAPGGGFEAVVSIQISAAAEGTLHAKSADGPGLTLQPLPYPLLSDI